MSEKLSVKEITRIVKQDCRRAHGGCDRQDDKISVVRLLLGAIGHLETTEENSPV